MKHYEFAQTFRSLLDKAVRLYREDRRSAALFFSPQEEGWLAANGLSAQTLYDYAEDLATYEEPGIDRALLIEAVRRDYFLSVQGGIPSKAVLDEASLPPKTEAVRGIPWLPRILPKARAKLRGELPPSLMYCCGGDRRFFKEHDILPSEFLALVWREASDAAVVEWVARRSAAAKAANS